MSLTYHKIVSKKQDNGLYGTSLSIGSMDNVLFWDKEDDGVKLSAILMAICEVHGNGNSNIRVEGINTTRFIKVDIYNSKLWLKDSKIYINLDDYGILGDKVYWIKSDESKKIFNRMVKLKRIRDEFFPAMANDIGE